jgi:hypothetical protein
MQVVENWADVSGAIASIAPHPTLRDWSVAQVKVGSVSAVPDFPNLFASAASHTLSVNVPTAKVSELSLAAGVAIDCRIRRGGPDAVFAHPDLISRR